MRHTLKQPINTFKQPITEAQGALYATHAVAMERAQRGKEDALLLLQVGRVRRGERGE